MSPPLSGLLVLTALFLVGGWLVATRVVRRFQSARVLLSHLAEGGRRTAPIDRAHPQLVPHFRHYNELVSRLEELERRYRGREQDSADDGHAATRALFEQARHLADADRLAAARVASAWVADQLRHPLEGMLASVENLKHDVGDRELGERLELLRGDLERTIDRLDSRSSVAHRRAEPPEAVCLSEMVEELLTLMRYQVSPGVDLRSEVAPGLIGAFTSDPVQQALLHLVLHSVEALNGLEGTVTVGAEKRDGGVAMTVEDDGPGFPSWVLESPGQPFPTGRELESGLRLAIVRRTVQDLDGLLRLENRQPHGAVARLWIPSGQ